MSITLTERAASAVKDIIAREGLAEKTPSLRVGLKGGGCSGFSYLLDLVEEPASDMDEELESNGVKILIDQKCLMYLEGTEIDYKDGVMGSGFTFNNPKAKHTCGCGSSFHA